MNNVAMRSRSAALFVALVTAVLSAIACQRSEAKIKPIEPAELAERMQKGTAPVILDVRSREEYAAEHIRGAINIPYDQLAERIDRLPLAKSDEIVVHCERGRRAATAE